LIDFYEFGRIVVDGVEYKRDVIILPDRIDNDWWRLEGHEFAERDLKKVLPAKPEVLVVGMGMDGNMKVLENAKRRLKEEGVELVAEKTDEAVKTYNDLLKAGRRVVAALHLSC
jgi:hypothetical protein